MSSDDRVQRLRRPDGNTVAYATTSGRTPTVAFLGGFRSDMTGTKAIALEGWARRTGRAYLRFDYLGHGQSSGRFEDGTIGRWLDDSLAAIDRLTSGRLVLVGSSMGGFVSVASASLLHARGVFLMAPALYMDGLPELRSGVLDCPAAVVHGWKDDVVPYEHSVRFAKEYGAALHLLDSDHRLHNQLRVVKYLFEYFLIALDLPPAAFE